MDGQGRDFTFEDWIEDHTLRKKFQVLWNPFLVSLIWIREKRGFSVFLFVVYVLEIIKGVLGNMYVLVFVWDSFHLILVDFTSKTFYLFHNRTLSK